MNKCEKCGKFFKWFSKWSWAMIYDLHHMQPDGEIYRCEKCTDEYGQVQSNASPYNKDMTPYQGINKLKK